MNVGYYEINAGRDDACKVACSQEIEKAKEGFFQAFDLDYCNHITLVRANIISMRPLTYSEIYS